MSSSSAERSSRQRSERASLPLPVIDLGHVLGPNFRYRRDPPANNDTGDTGRTRNEGEVAMNARNREQQVRDNGARTHSSNRHVVAYKESLDLESSQDEMTLEELKSLVNRTDDNNGAPSVAQPSRFQSPRDTTTKADFHAWENDMPWAELKCSMNSQKPPALKVNEAAISGETSVSKGLDSSAAFTSEMATDGQAVVGTQGQTNRKEEPKLATTPKITHRRRSVKRVPTVASDIRPNSLYRAVPLSQIPSDSLSESSIEEAKKIAGLQISTLANFPEQGVIQTDDGAKKNCAMCGNLRCMMKTRNDGMVPYIYAPTGWGCVCSSCEITAWTSVENKSHVRFCGQCKRFHPLASFAPKRRTYSENPHGLVSLCITCRATHKTYARKRKQNNAEEVGASASNDGATVESEVTRGADRIAPLQGGGNSDSHVPTATRKRLADKRVATVATDIASNSLNRCVPIAQIPFEFQSSNEEAEKITVPRLLDVANFQQQRASKTATGTTKTCVLCGNTRPLLKKRSDGAIPYVYANNKGVCSNCEVTVWELVESDSVRVKFCTQCLNLRPLPMFAPKSTFPKQNGLLTSCSGCRKRASHHAKKKRTEADGGSGTPKSNCIINSEGGNATKEGGT